MLVHYIGELGEFDYDDTYFELTRQQKTLSYKRPEDLHVPPDIIPKGILTCSKMFKFCNLIEPPHIPNSVRFCDEMFAYCKNLISTPVIPPSVQIAEKMFKGCENLKHIVNIPTTLKYKMRMFEDCVSLETAPDFDIRVDYDNMYLTHCMDMFRNCTNLKHINRKLFDVKVFEFFGSNSDYYSSCRSHLKNMYDRCSNLKDVPSCPKLNHKIRIKEEDNRLIYVDVAFIDLTAMLDSTYGLYPTIRALSLYSKNYNFCSLSLEQSFATLNLYA